MPTPEAQAAARDLLLAICSVGPEEEIGKTCADALDRFAAQRGAEAWLPIETAPKDGTRIVLTDGDVPVVGLWRAHDEQWIVDWDHKPYQDSPRETPATRWMPLPSNKPGAPPQTGGGDAGERAREHASAVLYRVTEHLAKTGEWAEEDIEALRAGLAMLDSREADLRSSHREGAEARRIGIEAIDFAHQWIAGLPVTPSFEDKRAAQASLEEAQEQLRALPILGKTDAG